MSDIDTRIRAASQGWLKIPSYRSAFAFIQIPSDNAVILDIGCSKGDHTQLWRREGNQVIGVDTDKTALDIACKAYPDIDFRLLQNSYLPLSNNSIDLVIMLDAIEHVENEELALMEIWRVLKPGGKLVLTTPFRNIFGDWMDGDNLFFIPLYRLKNWILRRPITFSRHRHYTTADLMAFCPDKFEVVGEEITGGFGTAFLSYFTKLLGKLLRMLPTRLRRVSSPSVTKFQARLKIMSQNSHFHRRKQSLANKLNLLLAKHIK